MTVRPSPAADLIATPEHEEGHAAPPSSIAPFSERTSDES
jgi:hypothetical protein